jgi:hypothetical protein
MRASRVMGKVVSYGQKALRWNAGPPRSVCFSHGSSLSGGNMGPESMWMGGNVVALGCLSWQFAVNPCECGWRVAWSLGADESNKGVNSGMDVDSLLVGLARQGEVRSLHPSGNQGRIPSCGPNYIALLSMPLMSSLTPSSCIAANQPEP